LNNDDAAIQLTLRTFSLTLQTVDSSWKFGLGLQFNCRFNWCFQAAGTFKLALRTGPSNWPFKLALQTGSSNWPFKLALQTGPSNWLQADPSS